MHKSVVNVHISATLSNKLFYLVAKVVVAKAAKLQLKVAKVAVAKVAKRIFQHYIPPLCWVHTL